MRAVTADRPGGSRRAVSRHRGGLRLKGLNATNPAHDRNTTRGQEQGDVGTRSHTLSRSEETHTLNSTQNKFHNFRRETKHLDVCDQLYSLTAPRDRLSLSSQGREDHPGYERLIFPSSPFPSFRFPSSPFPSLFLGPHSSLALISLPLTLPWPSSPFPSFRFPHSSFPSLFLALISLGPHPPSPHLPSPYLPAPHSSLAPPTRSPTPCVPLLTPSSPHLPSLSTSLFLAPPHAILPLSLPSLPNSSLPLSLCLSPSFAPSSSSLNPPPQPILSLSPPSFTTLFLSLYLPLSPLFPPLLIPPPQLILSLSPPPLPPPSHPFPLSPSPSFAPSLPSLPSPFVLSAIVKIEGPSYPLHFSFPTPYHPRPPHSPPPSLPHSPPFPPHSPPPPPPSFPLSTFEA
ncbi:hypothetical protein C7M84_000594 [Penaeus vannamei]|uniref:Uncharacterized protein n=1 Tax=Penaeus vannamei TaxID=6689 RepID=A0A423TW31_PENVA|nr:hypothetical protein C7M84_000594 [Penaeus vannamei]